MTQIYIGIMTADAIGIGLVVHRANGAEHPEEYFTTFLCLFLVLFTTSGANPFPVSFSFLLLFLLLFPFHRRWRGDHL